MRAASMLAVVLGISGCAMAHGEADETFRVESEHLPGCQNQTGVVSPVRARIDLGETCLLVRMGYLREPRVEDLGGVRVEGGPYLPDELRFAAMDCREWFRRAFDEGDASVASVSVETATGWLRTDMGTPYLPRLGGDVTFDAGDGVLRRVVIPQQTVGAAVSCGF